MKDTDRLKDDVCAFKLNGLVLVKQRTFEARKEVDRRYSCAKKIELREGEC